MSAHEHECIHEKSWGEVQTQLHNLRDYVDVRFTGIDKNMEVTTEQIQRRLTSMNEFRDALRDQASRFITVSEVRAMREAIDADLRVLREARATMEGKASASSVYLTTALALLGILLGMGGLVLRIVRG